MSSSSADMNGSMASRIAMVTCALALVSQRANAQPTPTGLDEAVTQHRLSTTAASPHDREVAQYRLAIALYEQRLYQASFGIFAEIADHPSHVAFQATLPWLAKLATQLPEPADVAERVGKYGPASLDPLQAQQPSLYWHLEYLLGRSRFGNGQYEDALALFAKVGALSKYYRKAQFFSGVANVHLRRPIEAVQSYQRVVDATVDDGEEDHIRDLALLSIARTYYSTSIRIDGRGAIAIHKVRLAAAVKSWLAVDVTSEFWLDALFEQSWASFASGDHARALGNVHTLRLVFPESSYSPEVDILKSAITIANCQYDDAATLAARFHVKYQPIAIELTTLLRGFDGDEQDERAYQLALDIRNGRANVSAPTRRALELALGDRQFLRHLSYVVVLDDEKKRFVRAPPAFRDSPLGLDIADSIQLARDIAVRNAGVLVRERAKRQLGELEEHLRDNVKLLTGAIAGQHGALDQALIPLRVAGHDAERNVVRPDDEHVIWPFTGELWSDEVGTYRQSIRSKCR